MLTVQKPDEGNASCPQTPSWSRSCSRMSRSLKPGGRMASMKSLSWRSVACRRRRRSRTSPRVRTAARGRPAVSADARSISPPAPSRASRPNGPRSSPSRCPTARLSALRLGHRRQILTSGRRHRLDSGAFIGDSHLHYTVMLSLYSAAECARTDQRPKVLRDHRHCVRTVTRGTDFCVRAASHSRHAVRADAVHLDLGRSRA